MMDFIGPKGLTSWSETARSRLISAMTTDDPNRGGYAESNAASAADQWAKGEREDNTLTILTIRVAKYSVMLGHRSSFDVRRFVGKADSSARGAWPE
jgi:hypothetical protein